VLFTFIRGTLSDESARVAMFGHACSSGGREEMAALAVELDAMARSSRRRLPSWDELKRYFPPDGREPLPDGAKELRLRLW